MNNPIKGIKGYETYIGMVTVRSLDYYISRVNEVMAFTPELCEELSDLYYEFSKNIDKEKKLEIMKKFQR